MPNSCKSQNLSAVKPTKFYDSVFKENAPPGLNLITVFSKKIFPSWPRIQERLELFPGLETDVLYGVAMDRAVMAYKGTETDVLYGVEMAWRADATGHALLTRGFTFQLPND
jgi:hypothetical protein